MTAPTGEQLDANLIQSTDGDYRVEWTPKEPGACAQVLRDVKTAGVRLQVLGDVKTAGVGGYVRVQVLDCRCWGICQSAGVRLQVLGDMSECRC